MVTDYYPNEPADVFLLEHALLLLAILTSYLLHHPLPSRQDKLEHMKHTPQPNPTALRLTLPFPWFRLPSFPTALRLRRA